MFLKIDEEIELRSYTSADAEALFEAVDASRAFLRNWLEWIDITKRIEHAADYIYNAGIVAQQQEALILGIFKSGRLIGGVDMHHWDHDLNKAEIGYWLRQDFTGKGIMTRCLVPFIDFLFDRILLNKIEIKFVPANTGSAAVVQRLGAQIEGVLRDNYRNNGKYQDLIVAGILKHEWKNKGSL